MDESDGRRIEDGHPVMLGFPYFSLGWKLPGELRQKICDSMSDFVFRAGVVRSEIFFDVTRVYFGQIDCIVPHGGAEDTCRRCASHALRPSS